MFKKVFCLSLVLLLSIFCFSCTGGDGNIYELQEAYDNGWLTTDDIMNIGYYYQFGVVDGGLTEEELIGFEPKPKEADKLSKRVENKIKRAYRRYYLNKYNKRISLNKIELQHYYGTYQDCIVVAIYVHFNGDLYFIDEYEIGGVVIRNYCNNIVKVYHE